MSTGVLEILIKKKNPQLVLDTDMSARTMHISRGPLSSRINPASRDNSQLQPQETVYIMDIASV